MELKSYTSHLDEAHEVLLENSFANIYYFPDNNIGLLYWKKQCSFEQYKEVFQILLKKHKEAPVHYFLSDIRNQGFTSSEKKEWLKEVALKKAIEMGLKKAAAIVDNNPFKEFYMNIILRLTNTMGLPFKTFNNFEDAKNWFIN